MKKRIKIILTSFWILVAVLVVVFFISDNHKLPTASPTITDSSSSEEERGTLIKGCFYRLKDQIYCANKINILPDVDLDSFQVVDFLVAKDKNHVYIVNQISPDLDAQSFNKYSKEGLNLYYLYSDKNGVYSMGPDNKLMSVTLDIDTAVSIYPYYIKDKNGIYFNGNSLIKVNNVDPSTFRVLGGCASVEKSYAVYAADKSHVFVGDEIISGIDPTYFIQIAKIDSDEGEIPYSFFVWRDLEHVYVYCGTIIKEADLETFEYKDGRVQDKNNYYNFNTGGGSYGVVPKR